MFRAPAVYDVLKVTNRYVPGTNFVQNPDGTFNLSGGIAAVVNTWYEYQYLPVYTNGALNYPVIKNL